MSASNFIEMANKEAEIHGVEFELTTDLYEVFRTTQVSATVGGHGVVIDFTETETCPPEYRFNALVRDRETGEQIGTGNGGRDWEEALMQVHWQDVTIHFESN